MNLRETYDEKRRILVTPLDWGLGHATRCIPIIQELLEQDAVPLLASSGRAYRLLVNEFPELPAFELPDYNVRYLYRNMIRNFAVQAPHVFRCIRREHKTVRKIIREQNIDGIISDNRFGCYSPAVRSIFITHQLNIQGPGAFFEHIGNALHRRFIGRFDECWAPDYEAFPGLAGMLSHPAPFTNTRYIGCLSRLEPVEAPLQYDLLFLLSGPEPQRSKLEEILLHQVRHLSCRILLVQGKPEAGTARYRQGNVEIIHFLSMKELSRVISGSKMIVCRSGYSTIMDLAKLGKQAVFIPTPGQTEQEYLAGLFKEQGICYSQTQDAFDLTEALERSKEYRGFEGLSGETHDGSPLKAAVRTFLETIACTEDAVAG